MHHLGGNAELGRAAYDKAHEEVQDMGYDWHDPGLAKLAEALGLPAD